MRITLGHSLSLCAFRAGGLEVAGGALPETLLVAPWGTHGTSKGPCTVNEQTAAVFSANQKAIKHDGKLALDFGHNTVPGHAAYREPAEIAAYATASVVPNKGIVYSDLEWTPEGKRLIEGGHYKDLSPAVIRDKNGVVIALHSAAVCRHGEIDGLTLFSPDSKTQTLLTALSATLPADPSNPMKAALAKILALFGITVAADADDAAFQSALEEAAPKIEALTKGEAAEDAASKPAAMSADMKALKDRLDAMEAKGDDSRRNELLSQATAAGKVIPLSADVLKVTPLSVLEDIIKNATPGQVHLTRKTPTGEPLTTEVTALSADAIALGAKMGLTEDDLKKYGA